jgi:hypothetical protein
MKHIKTYETHTNASVLIIVDVQKSFKKFFSEMYLNELKKYCNNFSEVYQIWDNHIDGKNVDKDYLYDKNPDIPIHNDLYTFPNQKDLIEKRYNYDVDADFYRKILDKDTYKQIKEKENNNLLKKGDMFRTKEDTYIVYVGNNHKWFHCPMKLFNLLSKLKNQKIIIVGGSRNECFEDILTTCQSMGVIAKVNYIYTYSATQSYL